MELAKQTGLNVYYYGTLPARMLRNGVEAAAGRAPVVVVFYHRVADDGANPWTCSNAMFARQMRWLSAHYELVSLAEAQQRIRRGVNHRPCAAVTFDDGYAENCEHALPLLIREKIPCTYFVSTQFILTGELFPHDRAMGNHFRPNTIYELRELAESGIEIGAHTRTHADLGRLTEPAALRDEVVTAGEDLQRALGRAVRYFAFPYGHPRNMSAEAFHLAYDAGYEAVCSAYGGYNFPGDDAFHIQRVPADADLIRFKNWLTLDPRKRRIPRYQYDAATAPPTAAGALQP